MKKLHLVKQLDKHGCTIACLATILGKPYFHIRAILHEKNARLRNRYVEPEYIGLNCREAQKALDQMFDQPCQFIQFVSCKQLAKHCILYLCPLEGCYDSIHTIVFDAQSRQILDPAGELKNLDKFNVVCCIEIQ